MSHLKRENPLCRQRTVGPVLVASFGKEHTVVIERPARARAEALNEILHRHAGALRARDVEHDAAVRHHQRAVAERESLRHVVRHHQAGDVMLRHDALREREHLFRRARVERRRVLVEVGGKVHGRVTDSSGYPIVGATVKLKGTNQGTISDVNGNFVLKTGGNRELAVDYIGYESVTLPADTTKSLLIAMNEDQATLDEVVVVGYGSQSKGSITGAVASLKMSGTPQPTIGRKAFRKYLKESLVHPSDKDCARAKGKVILTFRVDKEGRPQDITVKKGLCASADEEAIRLIEEGPDWTMGEEPVEISIRF